MPNTRKDISTIQIDRDVKEDLDGLIKRKGETYSQIIRRLIEETHSMASKEMKDKKAIKETVSTLKRKRVI